MKRFAKMLVSLAAAGAATAFGQATLTDTFEGGVNVGGWTFNSFNPDTLMQNGGNPGWWLRNDFLDTFAPITTTTFGVNSPFVGNYRAAGVSQLSIDARTDHADFGAGGREFSILLRDMNGTPLDYDDDDYAYYVGSLVPQVGEGWLHYDFAIPSQSTDAVPAGWKGGWAGDGENFRPGVDWNDVIQSVEQVEFWWLNPSFFAIFQSWDVGIDNPSVTYVPEPASLGVLVVAGLLLARRR